MTSQRATNGFLGILSLNRVGIKSKILVIIAVPLLFMVGIGAVATSKLQLLTSTQEWVDHTHTVLEEADIIVASAVGMETGLRGYLLAGQEQFLEPYLAGEASAYDTFRSLRETVSDNPPQVVRLTNAENVLRQWQSQVAETELALRRQIGDSPTMNDMAAQVGRREGKVYFDAFRAMVAAFQNTERLLLEERLDALRTGLASGDMDPSAIQEDLRWVEHTHDVLAASQDLLAAAIDMETGMRGFLLTGADDFLEPYDAGMAIFDGLITDLSLTVSDNPPQVERLSEMSATINEWRTTVVQPNLQLRRVIGDAPTMDNISDLVGEGRGKAFFDEFRAIMAEFTGIEVGLMAQRQALAMETRLETRNMILGAVLVSVVIGGLMAWTIGTATAKAVQHVTKSMSEVANGNKLVIVAGQDRSDEVGEMARTLELFRAALIEKDDLEAAQRIRDADQSAVMSDISDRLAKLSDGDLTVTIRSEFPEDYETLHADFNRTVATLESTMRTVTSSVKSIKKGARELTTASTDLSQRTENQAATLEESAAALEELTTSVRSSASNALDVQRLTEAAAQKAESSHVVVGQAVEAMNEIDSSSGKIANIISVIDDIAFQTNLLALNAGVEAARAGEEGRGFAVVALEVRKLAQMCAEAAAEIKSLIGESLVQVRSGVDLVGRAGEALEEIVRHVRQVADQMSNIATATSEQSVALAEINVGVTQLDQVTQKNAAMVQETTYAIQILDSDSEKLTQVVLKFTLAEDNSIAPPQVAKQSARKPRLRYANG